MKKFKSKVALMMAISMAVSGGTSAFAAADSVQESVQVTPVNTTATAPQEVRSMLEGLATVESINEDKQVTVTIEEQTLVLNISSETLWINAETGIPSSIKDIKTGDQIYAFYSAAMTRSLPPQSSAIAIVTGVKKDQTIPRLMTVKEIVSTKENQISFLNTEGDLIVTVTKETPITPFKTKQIINYKDIQPGTKLFAFYDIVLLSYPGQTGAKKVVVVSTEAEETVKSEKPVKIAINGKNLELGKLGIAERNGNEMIPLRLVANTLGFTVQWNAKTKTASIDNGSVKTNLTVGKDAYYKASSRAIGLTAYFSYGASPELIKGRLYVPAKLFNLLYSNEDTVKVSGDTIHINAPVK